MPSRRDGLPRKRIVRLAEHLSSKVTEMVYRYQLWPVLTICAEKPSNDLTATVAPLVVGQDVPDRVVVDARFSASRALAETQSM